MQLTNLTDPVELTRQMIDIPSVSGEEGPLADAVEAALRGAGLAVSALAAVRGALEPRAGLRGALRGSRVRSTLALGVVVKVFAVHASSLQLTDALAILGTTLI